MSTVLRFILGAGVIIYFVMLISLLKKRLVDLKYSLTWLAAGVVMAIFIIFPNLLSKLMAAFGIVVPVNGLFLISICFVVIILMSLTSIVSKQSIKIKELVQMQALLEKRVRELEKENEVK